MLPRGGARDRWCEERVNGGLIAFERGDGRAAHEGPRLGSW